MKKRTEIILACATAVLVIAAASIWLLYASQKPSAPAVTSTSTAVSKPAPVAPPRSAKTKTDVKQNPAYSAIINKYAGYRFQFSNNCSQATPASFVIKKGLAFMLDNRENKAHLFLFGQHKYSVKPYGYALVPADISGAHFILCDGIQRASITIEP